MKIYTERRPFAIVERALLKHGSEDLKKTLDVFFRGKYSFCVLLRTEQLKSEKDQRVITRIIMTEKPAHTEGGFSLVEDRINLDWNTYLGINTYLVKPATGMYVGEARISIDTVLGLKAG